jgi:glutaryl-CoA dehydrogenase
MSTTAKAAPRTATDLFQAHDHYLVDELLTEEQKLIRDTARAHVSKHLKPIIEERFEKAEFSKDIVPGLAEIGAFGPFLPAEYGGPGLDQISYGLIMQEIERCDSGLRSLCSVQGSLAMYPIWKYGSEEQKRKWLPEMVQGKKIGCFGLTEPDFGSNPGGMVTTFKDKGDHYLLNGAKMWISNAPFADLAVVWAKAENTEGRIHGLIVERGMEGFTTPTTHGKLSASRQSHRRAGVRQREGAQGQPAAQQERPGRPMGCLDSARYGIAGARWAWPWNATTRRCATPRSASSSASPSGFQLTQKKLAEMITEITKAQLLTWRLGVLRNEGRATTAQISMAKRNNVHLALTVAREARQMLGGMGITNEYPIMRHMMNLESVVTYEGTHDIHLLITGHEVTGIAAFK